MSNKVGGYTTVLTATPVIDTAAYAAGDLVGSAAIDLTPAVKSDGLSPSSGVVQSVVVVDEDKQSINLDVYLFDSNPSNTTFTDNAAFNPADADLDGLIGVASVTDWKAQSTNSVGQSLNLGMPFALAAGAESIYAVLVTRGAPTYSAAGLTLRVGVLQD